MLRSLSKQDLWDSVIGGTILACGGGGIAPSPKLFDSMVDPVFDKGLAPQLMDLVDVSDGQQVFLWVGASDGVTRETKERVMAHPGYEMRWHHGYDSVKWIESQIRDMDQLYPLPQWAERPDERWAGAAESRLIELIGASPSAYIPTEMGPHVIDVLCSAAFKGKPVVDADAAGGRAVPELSTTVLNIIEAPIVPVVLATPWGDLIVYEKLLSWQRFEDLNRNIAVACGGYVGGMLAVLGATLKRGAVAGSVSKSIGIGRAIREATGQEDPVQAAIKASGGYLLFRGRISAFLFEEKGAFIWGETRIEGTGDFQNHTFRVWYKNENHVTFLDGNPYVTSPDLICILDTHTAQGLSNFHPKEYEWGREVTVIGIPCPPIWRTPRGLKIFNLRRFGFHLDYVPLEERAGLVT